MTRTEHDVRLAVDPGADPDAVARLYTFATTLDTATELNQDTRGRLRRPAGIRVAAVASAAAVVVAAVAAGTVVTRAGSDTTQNVAGNSVSSSAGTVRHPRAAVQVTSYGAGVGPQNLPGCSADAEPPATGGELGADTFGNFRIVDQGRAGKGSFTVAYQLGTSFVHFEICQTDGSGGYGQNDGYVDRNTGATRPWRPGVNGGLTVEPRSFDAFGNLGYLAVAVPADAATVTVLDAHGEPAATLSVFDELISPTERVAAGAQPVDEPSAIVSYDADGKQIDRQSFGPHRILPADR